MPWDSQKPGVFEICRKKLARIGTAQRGMLMDTKNKGGYVPSTAHGSENS